MRVKLKIIFGVLMFQFELANRLFNNVRALLLVLIIAKQFEIKMIWFPAIIIVYGGFTWLVGYIMDRWKLYKYIEGAYLDRSKTIDVLNGIDSKIKSR